MVVLKARSLTIESLAAVGRGAGQAILARRRVNRWPRRGMLSRIPAIGGRPSSGRTTAFAERKLASRLDA